MNYYEILGVDINAETEEIRRAYRALIKQYHPDVYIGDKAFAEEKTKELNEAYAVLRNNAKRGEYDRELVREDQYEPEEIFEVPSFSQNIKGVLIGVLIYVIALFGLPKVFELLFRIPGAGDYLYMVLEYPHGSMLVQSVICALFARIFSVFLMYLVDYGESLWAGKAVFILLMGYLGFYVAADTMQYGLYLWTVMTAVVWLVSGLRLWRMK